MANSTNIAAPASMPNNFVVSPSQGLSTPIQSAPVNNSNTGAGFLGTLGNVLNAIPVVGPLIGGLVGGISQTIQNSQNRAFESEQASLQRDWNEKMMDKQNQFSLDMWNRTNEYNSPSAQVDRMLEAGLNPLYYGLDGSSANAFQSAQPLGYDRASVGNQLNPVSTFGTLAQQVASVSNIQADTAKKNNENLTETQRREKTLVEVEEIRQDIKNKMASEKLTDAERTRLEKDIEWLDRLNAATLAEKEASAALSNAQKKRVEELLEGEKLIQAKTIEDFEYKWKKIEAEISKMAKETGLLEQDIENYAINHANNGFMGTGLSIPNLIRSAKERAKNKFKRNKDDDVRTADATATIVANKY